MALEPRFVGANVSPSFKDVVGEVPHNVDSTIKLPWKGTTGIEEAFDLRSVPGETTNIVRRLPAPWLATVRHRARASPQGHERDARSASSHEVLNGDIRLRRGVNQRPLRVRSVDLVGWMTQRSPGARDVYSVAFKAGPCRIPLADELREFDGPSAMADALNGRRGRREQNTSMRPTERPAQSQTTVVARGDKGPGQRITSGQRKHRPIEGRRSLIDALHDDLAFLRGFLRRPDEVGSVIPSSSALEQDLIAHAQLRAARCVVELGPGTGGTTRALLRAMPAESRLLAIELSPLFHARLGATVGDPRLIAQLGSAEHIGESLAAWRLPPPDAIVSGIPFSTMPAAVAGRIAAAIAKALAPGGRFVAYQFRAHVDRYVSPHLGSAERHWQWVNIPPVRVFTWTKR